MRFCLPPYLLAGFAHSANCACVGVSLRQTITTPTSIGSLIPTYLLSFADRTGVHAVHGF